MTQPLADARSAYSYAWPREDSLPQPPWEPVLDGRFVARALPETTEELRRDSRWPGFFPSPMALVTAGSGDTAVLERIVGPSIVNRFPYVLALSICTQELSERHYARRALAEALESTGVASVQLLAPGNALDAALNAVAEIPDERASERLRDLATTARSRPGPPVLSDAYLAFECRLLERDRQVPAWRDVGSHRVYFLEVERIELREDIATGRAQVHWRSLPTWQPQDPTESVPPNRLNLPEGRYTKGYTPDYRFPSSATVTFEHDEVVDGMAVRNLPTGTRADEQVEIDDDRARWPCFFPSSVGMVTAWVDDSPNLMPCGSTTVVSRHPLVVAPSISYTSINVRYAPRHTVDVVRRTRRFTVGVPYIDDDLVDALAYAGNVSWLDNRAKVRDAGFAVLREPWAPLLPALPVSFECEVVGEQELGTHSMVFGEVRRVLVRRDATAANPLHWCPWASVEPAGA